LGGTGFRDIADRHAADELWSGMFHLETLPHIGFLLQICPDHVITRMERLLKSALLHDEKGRSIAVMRGMELLSAKLILLVQFRLHKLAA
jgi:hypothetical protein